MNNFYLSGNAKDGNLSRQHNSPSQLFFSRSRPFFGLGFFFLICFMASSAYSADSNEIHIENNTRTIVAPESDGYQWFYNHEKLEGKTDQALQPEKSGIYTVELTTVDGTKTRKEGYFMVKANGAVRKIYLIGDSTVANYNEGYYPQTGWGQVLPQFFDAANVVIVNKAVGGTSSKSFYDYFWAPIRDGLQSGDYVFIQFGINDANKDPERYTEPFTTFQDYLTLFVEEARAKGAIPVLVSTLQRNAWNNTSPPTVYPAYHDYPVATRELANSSLNVPLIDLDLMSKAFLESVGPEYSTHFLYMNLAAGEYLNYPNGRADNVHFQEMGAIEMAKLIVQGIRDLSGDAFVSPLISFLKPTYAINTSSNDAAAGIITRSATYPEGLSLTLKARPGANFTVEKWTDGSSNTVSTSTMYSFPMGTAAANYQATFAVSENTSPIVSGGTYKITAKHSGQALDVNARSLVNGASLIQYPYSGGTNQQWLVQDVGSGYYTLTAKHSNKSMDVNARSTADGAALIQWTTKSTAANQQFKLVDAGSGYFQMIARHSNKCVDVPAASMKNGEKLKQWTCHGGDNQLFKFELLSSGTQMKQNFQENVELKNAGLLLYPNPSNSSFHLKWKGDFSYILLDQLGKVQEKGTATEECVLGEDLRPGLYFKSANRR